MKRILFTVTNDLTYDQRMQRICKSLANAGYSVQLIGRQLHESEPLNQRNFEQKRIKCWFNKTFLFYAEYNIRLFFYLISQKFDAICSIDLDTILPALFVAFAKRKTHIHDSHEYFSQMQEIISRPSVHKIWLAIEKFSIPKVRHGYTIGAGYAQIFKNEYNKDFEVIRNVPNKILEREGNSNKKTILYQGAINIGRGLEEIILAMVNLTDYQLFIAGKGTERARLEQLAEDLGVNQRTHFLGGLLPEKLRIETQKYWLGLTLFSEIGAHHQLSLANRFFDYIQCHVPQIVMNYPEYAEINRQYDIAYYVDELNAENLVILIRKIESNPDEYGAKKANCEKAAKELCWENEEIKLINFYNQIL